MSFSSFVSDLSFLPFFFVDVESLDEAEGGDTLILGISYSSQKFIEINYNPIKIHHKPKIFPVWLTTYQISQPNEFLNLR